MTQAEWNDFRIVPYIFIYLSLMLMLCMPRERKHGAYKTNIILLSTLVLMVGMLVAIAMWKGNTPIAVLFIMCIAGICIICFLPRWVKSKSHISQSNDLLKQLFRKKTDENTIASLSLICAFSGEVVLFAQTREISLWWIMILTVLLLLISLVNQLILRYRVEHSLYGTCYSEAKELVAFILELQENSDNSKGGTPKLIFTQEELDQCLQVNGGEEYAG